MIKLVGSGEMKIIDERVEREFNIPSLILMETAGSGATEKLIQSVWNGTLPAGPFVFLAGRGNNGGDAFVMARRFFAAGKKNVSIKLAAGTPPEESDPGVNLKICRSLGIPIMEYQQNPETCRKLLAESAVIFDGMAGTGLRGALKAPLAEIVEFVNSLPAMKIAIDLPSGLGDSFQKNFPLLKADITLTMGLPKRCLYLPDARPACGTIMVVPLGYPETLTEDPALLGELLLPNDFQRLLPALPSEFHKNDRGHLAVFAGAVGTTGAAVLSAGAAARARTGLVTLYTDPDAYSVIAAQLVSVMSRPVTAATLDTAQIETRCRALLIGPGFGLTEDKTALFDRLMEIRLPKVIDADGLTLLASFKSSPGRKETHPLVLTPHPGECARLLETSVAEVVTHPVEAAVSVSQRFNAVCVLKTHVTFITEPDGRFAVSDGMNPGLGTGGSGDVLAGLIAAFLTQGMTSSMSARLGVLLHARIGADLADEGWFLAEDMLSFVSTTLTLRTGGDA